MAATDKVQLTVHERDPEQIGADLAPWLAQVLDADGPVRVSEVVTPESGYSGATILFAATWQSGGKEQRRELVAKLPPEQSSFPVFPTYDFALQRDVIGAVRAAGVPAPEVVALEETGEVLGAPVLLFARVGGEVPSDNPPYVFGGWVMDATLEQHRRMLTSSMDVLAKVHTVDPAAVPSLHGGPDALRRHVDEQRAYYEWTMREDGVHVPILEEAFAWLEQHWPAEVSETVLCWGDARIGNIGYDDFAAESAFDWEMACAAPPELDLAWFCFLHRFFQDIAEVFELPGMPDFLHRDDVVAAYEAASGRTVRDFDWYLMYAALRDGIVMSKIRRRMIHYGQESVPVDPDEYVMHHATLRRMLDGTYDWGSPAGVAL